MLSQPAVRINYCNTVENAVRRAIVPGWRFNRKGRLREKGSKERRMDSD